MHTHISSTPESLAGTESGQQFGFFISQVRVCMCVWLEVLFCHFNVLYLLEELMIGPPALLWSLVDDRI